MGRKRSRPSSPAEIQARRALERGHKAQLDRSIRRSPAQWGIPEGLHLLPANEDVDVAHDPHRRGKLLRARRSDAFSLVSMSDEQRRAADRYVKLWMVRAGVDVDGDELRHLTKTDTSPGLAPGQLISQRIVDAGWFIEALHKEMGRGSARLLQALVEPLAMHGEVRVWRVIVQTVTGETEKHAQGVAVRLACADLRLALEVVDELDNARREDRRDRLEREALAAASPYAGGGRFG